MSYSSFSGRGEISRRHEIYSLEFAYETKVRTQIIDWKHGTQENNDNSHQIGYLQSMANIYTRDDVNQIQYSLVSEDDFYIKTYNKDLEYFLNKAVNILQNNSNIMQIRIPRFSNEFDRINHLKEKHGIDTRAIESKEDNEIFLHGDWSNNPFIARTRDLRNAILLIIKNEQVLGCHSEHSMGKAMKYFSLSDTPFVCFKPDLIRIGHRGCPVGLEDNLDQPLIST